MSTLNMRRQPCHNFGKRTVARARPMIDVRRSLMMHGLGRLLTAALLAVVAIRGSSAQVGGSVSITVLDSASGRPVDQAVAIADRLVRLGTTDSSGVLRARLAAGRHAIEIRSVGYRATSLMVNIAPDGATTEIVRLPPVSRSLDTVRVATLAPAPSYLGDFERRRSTATHGYFLTRAQLDSLRNHSLSEILRSRAPGARLVGSGAAGGEYLASTRPRIVGALLACGSGDRRGCAASDSARACYATVYVDGLKVFAMSTSPYGGQTPYNMRDVAITQLDAVEYYANSAVAPLEFRDGNADCGILMLWHRMR